MIGCAADLSAPASTVWGVTDSRTIPHPWQDLATRWRHVRVDHVDELPTGLLAVTDGDSQIWMRRRLLQAERRCALAHEIIHLERGDTGPCTAAVEAEVNREVARRLIPMWGLVEAVKWTQDEAELADELWVTVPILQARWETLRADEIVELARAANLGD